MTTTLETTINGVDVEAVKALAAALERDACAGMATFRVRTEWDGGTRSTTRVDEWALGGERKPRGFLFQTDEPPELAGEGLAPNPQEVLMGAINACMMVGYVACAALMGIELKSLSLEMEGTLDLRGFLNVGDDVRPGYDAVRQTVRIKGDGTEEQFRQLHALVQKTSPNFWNLTHAVANSPRLVVG